MSCTEATKPKKRDDSFESHLIPLDTIHTRIKKKTASIHHIKNNDKKTLAKLNTLSSYINYLLAEGGIVHKIYFSALNKLKPFSLAGFITLVIFLQYCDKVSLIGTWRDTVAAMNRHISNTVLAYVAGSLFFLPYLGLTTKVTHETIKKISAASKKSILSMVLFIKTPDRISNKARKITFALATMTLIIAAYYFSYKASDTREILNEKYDYNFWWNKYPTMIASTVFDGYGFLNISISLFRLALFYAIYSPSKRELVDKHNNVASFFHDYPDSIEQIARDQTTGFSCGRIAL